VVQLTEERVRTAGTDSGLSPSQGPGEVAIAVPGTTTTLLPTGAFRRSRVRTFSDPGSMRSRGSGSPRCRPSMPRSAGQEQVPYPVASDVAGDYAHVKRPTGPVGPFIGDIPVRRLALLILVSNRGRSCSGASGLITSNIVGDDLADQHGCRCRPAQRRSGQDRSIRDPQSINRTNATEFGRRPRRRYCWIPLAQ
jgi:hypothetical protein